jgi:hypothetical protein
MVEGKQQEIEFKICSEYWYLFEPLQKLKFLMESPIIQLGQVLVWRISFF